MDVLRNTLEVDAHFEEYFKTNTAKTRAKALAKSRVGHLSKSIVVDCSQNSNRRCRSSP